MYGDKCSRYTEKQSEALITKPVTRCLRKTVGSQCFCLLITVSDKIAKHFGRLIREICRLICCCGVAVRPGYILSARTGFLEAISYGVIILLSLDTGGGTV